MTLSSSIPQLDLCFATTAIGRTVIRTGASRFPLRHSPGLYLDEATPHFLTCFVTNSTGGLFDQDQLHARIRLKGRSKVRLTSASSTVLHKALRTGSRECWELEVDTGGYCEMVRRPLIPTIDAKYKQLCEIRLQPDSLVILADTVLSGRFSAGERHSYQELSFRLDVVCNDLLLVSERTRLRQKNSLPALRGSSGWNYLGTIYCVGVGMNWGKIEAELINKFEKDNLGLGCLPNEAGLMVRYICHSSVELHCFQCSILERLRMIFAGYLN